MGTKQIPYFSATASKARNTNRSEKPATNEKKKKGSTLCLNTSQANYFRDFSEPVATIFFLT